MTPGELLVSIVIGLVFGLCGYLIGKPKGHPVWGFFICFFLSIIGILIIVLTKPAKR